MIQTENTPNPNALKFLSEKQLSEIETQEFQKKDLRNIKNEFVKNILNFDGVELVLISKNFMSVKKDEKTSWETLKPTIISSINDYFEKNNQPMILKKNSTSKKIPLQESETVQQIKDVLETKVRPAVAKDGGDIQFISFNNGVVKVALKGSCSGCPSSVMTLKQGVQNLLCHYVKEVKSVEAS
tara:strand:- start:810 stop:1361 length:552 start_codon:yes stop_codon:yes gene_type:complete